ncbi:homocysteine S-methyltransferase family protein [Clostridium sp. DL1XJH146]
MEIRKKLGKEFIFFDGAMGTMLQKRGLKRGEIPETYNIEHPEIIKDIHHQYIQAGANILTINTFGANELKLKETGYSVEEIIYSATSLAKEAKGDADASIALDLGPIGQLMEPMGTLPFERAYDIYKRQVLAGVKAGCDLIIIETISDLYEAKAAILAAKENSHLPVFCTMTFDESLRTLSGSNPVTMVNVLESLGVDALGINCSLGPKEMMPVVDEILKYSSIPVMVQPNAGLPKIVDNATVYDVTPTEFSSFMKEIAKKGVSILGGCCGTDETFIKELVSQISIVPFVKNSVKKYTTVSSSTKTVFIGDTICVVGERINPTGKKKFKEALKNNDMDYILGEAISQMEAGADILDVNVGLPEINEEKVMVKAIKEIQSIINLPLQIDSSSVKVIESAVRVYNGKPLINSVNGKEKIMEEIFPIVKKYGACVIGLTLDEKGIPGSAHERFAVAKKIIDKAAEYGIPKENVLIDCLVLTASAQQKEVLETVKAVEMVKEQLGVKTLLGVSNVSFGLPNRDLLNTTFLSMALANGLDVPILNPLSKGMMDTIMAYKVLANEDKDSKNFISFSSNKEYKSEIKAQSSDIDLKEIVIKGLKEKAIQATKELLEKAPPLEIVDKYLISALDIVGDKYEKGEIFLPQLIQSAETVKNSFSVIKDKLIENNETKISKGKIILATVQGDIHDIGKNIVKILLENYGYDVIDLGKDVPIDNVVNYAKTHDIKFVGLSALMTTTVVSMQQTIKALRDNGLECKVVVGGAVLNEEYADMIGADYYAKDAREAVTIAKEIFKEN